MKIFLSVLLCFSLWDFSAVAAEPGGVFAAGERIDYAIKKMGVKVGEASLEFKGRQMINGQEAILIIFTARALKFYDQERIYVHPRTFLPIIVERDLNILGKKEKITERYDESNGRIIIEKKKGKKIFTEEIERSGKVENIYGFIYRYRKEGSFGLGDSLGIRLPTKDIRLELFRKYKMYAGGKQYDSFFMRSKPSKYKVWFADGSAKIPLRIDGAGGLGSTSLIMSNYQPGKDI